MAIMNFLDFAKSIAIKAGRIVKDGYYSELTVERKAEMDYVTQIDKASEKAIRDAITSEYPEHGFLGEESGSDKPSAEYVWVVDPLDGTTNFVYKIPYFSISIALKHRNETVVGVVYNPITEELFYAEKGKGAFLNGKKIEVKNSKPIEKWFLAFCFRDNMKNEEAERIIFDAFYFQVARLLKLGSAALELCYAACGRVDGYIGLTLKEWDYAAGDLIVREANGSCNHTLLINKNVVIAGNKENVLLIRSKIISHNDYPDKHEIG